MHHVVTAQPAYPPLTHPPGFIDQGEGIEEAVVREVREEAGVRLSRVAIVGSQPWPIGRGGSCELMIGCLARAAGEELQVDPEEMEEVRSGGQAAEVRRWVRRRRTNGSDVAVSPDC